MYPQKKKSSVDLTARIYFSLKIPKLILSSMLKPHVRTLLNMHAYAYTGYTIDLALGQRYSLALPLPCQLGPSGI